MKTSTSGRSATRARLSTHTWLQVTSSFLTPRFNRWRRRARRHVPSRYRQGKPQLLQTHLQASHRKLQFASTLRMLYRDEGLIRFWRGSQIMASGCVPAHACYFAFYEQMKLRMEVRNEVRSLVANFSSEIPNIVHNGHRSQLDDDPWLLHYTSWW